MSSLIWNSLQAREQIHLPLLAGVLTPPLCTVPPERMKDCALGPRPELPLQLHCNFFGTFAAVDLDF